MRIGPFKVGTMYGPLLKAFQEHQVHFVPLLDMKTGRLQETIERARHLLLNHPQWKHSQTVDFFGHSTGALIARALLQTPEIREKTRSLLSLGAPHLGAEAANHALNLAQKNSQWIQLAKWGGWDWETRQKIIMDLSPESLTKFNEQNPQLTDIHYACLLCSCPPNDLTTPMKGLAKLTQQTGETDGLIALKSQKYGESLGPFQLDHLSQIGYFLSPIQKRRKSHQEEFARMITTSINFWTALS